MGRKNFLIGNDVRLELGERVRGWGIVKEKLIVMYDCTSAGRR